MTLDLPTLLVVSAAVTVLVSALFIGEAWARRGMAVDRLWSLSFIAVIATALASLVAVLEPAIWWASAVANGCTALAVWAIWSGARAQDRRPLLEVSGGVSAVVLLAALLDGPQGGNWAGGEVMLGAVALGAFLIAWAVVRGPLRAYRSATTLAVIAVLMGAYYTLRLVGYVAFGPDSDTFTTYLGTELSTVVLVLLVTGAAFTMVALRTVQAAESQAAAHNFDPATGARTPQSFQRRAQQLLARSAERGQPLCLVVLAPEALQAVEVAFGRPYAQHALEVCGDAVRELAPPGALVGMQRRHGHGFEVLLPGSGVEPGRRWADEVRWALVDRPVDVPGSRIRLTLSAGVASTDSRGYDLPALRCGADGTLHQSQTDGLVAEVPIGGMRDPR